MECFFLQNYESFYTHTNFKPTKNSRVFTFLFWICLKKTSKWLRINHLGKPWKFFTRNYTFVIFNAKRETSNCTHSILSNQILVERTSGILSKQNVINRFFVIGNLLLWNTKQIGNLGRAEIQTDQYADINTLWRNISRPVQMINQLGIILASRRQKLFFICLG